MQFIKIKEIDDGVSISGKKNIGGSFEYFSMCKTGSRVK